MGERLNARARWALGELLGLVIGAVLHTAIGIIVAARKLRGYKESTYR